MNAQQGQVTSYLTIVQAHERIKALGFNVSHDQVRSWAIRRRLPFFKFEKVLYIEENELIMWFRRLQLEAVRNLKN